MGVRPRSLMKETKASGGSAGLPLGKSVTLMILIPSGSAAASLTKVSASAML